MFLRLSQEKGERMQEQNLKIITMRDVEAVSVKWLIYPYIPYGKITIVQGNPGEGKTTMMLAVIAAMSRGEDLKCGREGLQRPATDFISGMPHPLASIYQTAEDGLADTIKPRLEMLGADCSRIHVIDDTELQLTMLDTRIEAAIRRTGAKLIVLDPIQGYLGAGINMNQSNEIRPVMAKLAQVAERTECAVVLIGHMNKCFGGVSAMYRLLGSVDFTAAARSVLMVGRTRDDPEQRYAIPVKASLTAEAPGIGFRLDGNSFSWTGESEMTAEELLGAETAYTSEDKPKQKEAYDFIMKYLNEHGGREKAAVLFNAAKTAGIAEHTVYRMRRSHDDEIGIQKNGDIFWWHL